MEREVRAEFDEIRAILRDVAASQEQAEKRAELRHQQAELRHQQAELRLDRAEARMAKYDQRMAKYDQRFEATRRLVEGGIKFVQRMDERQSQKLATLAQTVDKLAKAQQAFLDSLRRGGNGNGRRRG